MVKCLADACRGKFVVLRLEDWDIAEGASWTLEGARAGRRDVLLLQRLQMALLVVMTVFKIEMAILPVRLKLELIGAKERHR